MQRLSACEWRMTDEPSSMFDYDARPVTPQVVLVGRRASSLGYELRDFLSRNGVPYDWVESRRRGSRSAALRQRRCRSEPTSDLRAARRQPARRSDGRTSRERTGHGGRAALGRVRHRDHRRRARGLAAAVYAASEGLRTGCDRSGRARRTSGHDIDDRELSRLSARHQRQRVGHACHRAGASLRRRSAAWLGASSTSRTTATDIVARLSDGTEVRTRSVLAASGVDWRRLEVDGLDELLGAGVYYGAGPSEAVSCRGCRVAIIGGGNSAGQAAVRFSRYASRVTLLVRGPTLGASMSQYLISKVSELDNVDVRTGTEVVGLEADTRLRAVVLSSRGEGGLTRLPVESLFVCIGGVPRTRGLAANGLALDDAGFMLTGADVTAAPGALDRWPLCAFTAAARDESAGLLRRRRRAQRIDQALFRCDR